MQTQNNNQGKIFYCDYNLPKDNDKVWFVTKKTHTTFQGVYIESENMFFIGFGESGDFRFKEQIDYWGYLDEEQLQLVEKGVFKSFKDEPEDNGKVIFKLRSDETKTFLGTYNKSKDSFSTIIGDSYKRTSVSIWWYIDYETRYNITLKN